MKILKKELERIYLDFASQTMPSKKVLIEMKKVSGKNFNPNNIYTEGILAEKVLNEARERMAKVFVVKAREIYFTNNATLSCAGAILGTVLFYKNNFNFENNIYIKPHIITSNIEHSAVLENIKYLERLGEIEVTYLKCDEFGIINVSYLLKEIKENTILISIMYANNEVGTIQDIKNIGKGIREWKKKNGKELFSYPYFHTDASQAGNYLSLSIQSLGVDMLSLNGSKIYGPKSSALLFKKENINILPFYFGGGQERKIFSGTVDVERVFGLAVAFEEAQKKVKNTKFLEKVAMKRNLLLKNILKNIPEAKMIGAFSENEWKENNKSLGKNEREIKRLPNNISLWLPDFNSDEAVIRLSEKGFAISAGSACSTKENNYSHVIFAILKDKKIAKETIRVSIDNNTKEKDLERFSKVLKEIYYKFKNK